MNTTVDDQVRQRAEAFVRQRVAMGFDDADTIHGAALDYIGDAVPFDRLESYLGRLTRRLLAEHCQAQQGWPAETDCDRLDFAFLLLQEEHRVVARQHFTCCQSDGHNQIWVEIRAARRQGPVIGYVFYHQQDTERAVEDGRLYLAHGSADEGKAAGQDVARCIVGALQEAGLAAEWSGDPRQRIKVTLDWRRRRECRD